VPSPRYRPPVRKGNDLWRPAHDLGEPKDKVEWRAQLVADVGGELGLQTSAVLGLSPRHGQFAIGALQQFVGKLQAFVEAVDFLLPETKLPGQDGGMLTVTPRLMQR